MSSSSPATYPVAYFIAGDGDTEENPNVFLTRRPLKDLRLGDVQAAFPLPGQYFFRAKATYGKTYGACAGGEAARGWARRAPAAAATRGGRAARRGGAAPPRRRVCAPPLPLQLPLTRALARPARRSVV